MTEKKERKKRSPIWQIERDDLMKVVSQAKSLSDVLTFFGFPNRGGNYKTLEARLSHEGIDVEVLKESARQERLRRLGETRELVQIPLKEILVDGREYDSGKLKKRLISEGLLEEKCSECGLLPEWNGKPLVLQLDHKNGKHDDNRIENIQLLCPNCHSQTNTFAGRRHAKVYVCVECGSDRVKQSGSGLCQDCSNKQRRLVQRPSLEVLQRQVSELGYSGTGRLYGVSDNAIRKWLRS